MPKLGEPVGKNEHSGAKLVFGAVKRGADNLLAQILPVALNQVHIGRAGLQKYLAGGLVGQSGPQRLVFVVARVVTDDVNTRLVGVSGQLLLVQVPGALGLDAAGFIAQHPSGGIGVEVYALALAAADRKQGPLFAGFAPGAGAARGMSRIGVLAHGLAPLDVGFEDGQLVEKVGLRHRIGLAGHGRGAFAGKAPAVEQVRAASLSVYSVES